MNELATMVPRARTPAEADEAAVSRARSRGVAVALESSWRFPKSAQAYQVVGAARIRTDDAGAVAATLAEFRASMTPASTDQLENWLAVLEAGCARRGSTDLESEVLLSTLTADLGRFPADVVRQACEAWRVRKVRGPNWFPTNAELVSECEALAAPRASIIRALEAWRPMTVAERLLEEADDWIARAYELEEAQLHFRKSDPVRSAELADEMRHAQREAKRCRIEAREAARG